MNITKNPPGYLRYYGALLLDGKPIMVVALLKSRSGKTGNMVQTYIMRSDMNPMKASKMGEDFSICGNCPHKGIAVPDDPVAKQAKERPCYVILIQGTSTGTTSYVTGNSPVPLGHNNLASLS